MIRLAALALIALPASAQEFTFKLHHLLGPTAPAQTQMLEPWAERVEQLSDGRVEIEIYPAMSLGGTPPELIQQARDGVVDIVWTVNGYTPGLFPRTEVFELPGIHINDPAATNRAMYELFDQHLAEDYRGVHVLWLHVHAGQALQMVDREVRSPADLDGARLRIPSRTGAWVIEALGAAPVAMPVPELPNALAKSVVDGALIPYEIIPPLQIQNQTTYQIEGANGTRFGNTTFQVSMNQARWDSLPADIQAAFTEASGPEWWAEVGEIWAGTDVFGIGIATEAGNSHIVLSEAETAAFDQALAPVVDRWVNDVSSRGIDGAGLVEAARLAVQAAGE